MEVRAGFPSFPGRLGVLGRLCQVFLEPSQSCPITYVEVFFLAHRDRNTCSKVSLSPRQTPPSTNSRHGENNRAFSYKNKLEPVKCCAGFLRRSLRMSEAPRPSAGHLAFLPINSNSAMTGF